MAIANDHDVLLKLRDRMLDLGARPSMWPGAPPDRVPREELERVAPFAELMFLSMEADQRGRSEERQALKGAFRALTGGRFSSSVLDDMLVSFERALEAQGRDARLELICAALAGDREDAEGAFSLAAAVALADGELDPRELQLLQKVARWLGLGPATATNLLQLERASLRPRA